MRGVGMAFENCDGEVMAAGREAAWETREHGDVGAGFGAGMPWVGVGERRDG